MAEWQHTHSRPESVRDCLMCGICAVYGSGYDPRGTSSRHRGVHTYGLDLAPWVRSNDAWRLGFVVTTLAGRLVGVRFWPRSNGASGPGGVGVRVGS
jgi:hypothetical protein